MFVKVTTQSTAYTNPETKLVNLSLVTVVEAFGTGARLWFLYSKPIEVEQTVDQLYDTLTKET
jgi:hypothetical protein